MNPSFPQGLLSIFMDLKKLLKNIRIRRNKFGLLCLFEINVNFALVLLKPGKEINDMLICISGGPDLDRIRIDSCRSFLIMLAF